MTDRVCNSVIGDTEDGFTLVEVLVALALVSLLSVLTLNSLDFGIQAWRRSSESAIDLDDRVHAEGVLRHLLSQISPRFIARPGGTGYVDFEGRATSLRLIADPPRSLSGTGPVIFILGAEETTGRTDLTLSSRPELLMSDAQQPLSQSPLLENAVEIEFSYYGAKNGPPGWHKEWIRETHLPELIKISFGKLPGKVETHLLIRPRIDVDITCIHDPLSRRCRGR